MISILSLKKLVMSLLRWLYRWAILTATKETVHETAVTQEPKMLGACIGINLLQTEQLLNYLPRSRSAMRPRATVMKQGIRCSPRITVQTSCLIGFPFIALRDATPTSKPSCTTKIESMIDQCKIDTTFNPNKLSEVPLPEPVGTGQMGVENAFTDSACSTKPLNNSWIRPSPDSVTTAS